MPFGLDTISAVYALGFAARSALTFGGMDAGDARRIMLYNKYRVFAFVLALGEVDDLKYATAAGAISYGFPVIADTRIPQILPTGVTTYEHVVSMPFDEIPGADDMERTEKLIQRAIEVRGVKVKIAKVPIPVSYGSAFEGERVRKEAMYAEFGGKRTRAFEYLRSRPADEVEDGKVTLVGPDIDAVDQGRRTAAGYRRRRGRPQDADRLRAHRRAPVPLLHERRRGHPAQRPARHHLDPRERRRLRQGLSPGAPRQAYARPHPRRVRQHRRQGAGAR